MPRWPHLSSFWRNIFHKDRVESELDSEVSAFVEQLTEEKIQAGMSPEEARRAALIELGGVEQVKEQVRDVRIGVLLDTVLQDLRLGCRMLLRNRGFTAVAILSLALGIGATTAAFSIYDTIFLRPFSYPESDRLVGVWEKDLKKSWPDGWENVSTPTLLDWKKQSRSFEELAQYDWDEWGLLQGSDRLNMVPIRRVGEGFFHMLGARACLGRLFTSDEYLPGGADSVVLSYGAWQRFFGSNPSVVDNTIRVDGKLMQVVGVLSPEFQPIDADRIDLWLAINQVSTRESRWWLVIGRLKPGVSLQEAQAEMDVVESRLARQYPEQKGIGARIEELHDHCYLNQKGQIQAFFYATVLVLLTACTNVANLLLARAATREKEMAVRASLGGGRLRLVRQLLTESLLLSGLGAGLGLLLAYGGVRLAVDLSPENAIPRADEISMDVRILAFVVFITGLTTLLFGMFPALGGSKPDLNESLKEGGRRSADQRGARRIQGALVVGQIAVSLVLLIGAGLMIHNVWRQLHGSVGFNTDHLAQKSIQLGRFDYVERIGDGTMEKMKPKAALTVKAIEERLRALPGVDTVSVSGEGVLSDCGRRPISAEGPPRKDRGQRACYEPVGPGYFRLLEIPVLKGRDFTEADSRNSPPVAIISQRLAQQYFPGQDPIGKMVNIGIWEADDFEQRLVVGVAADVRWTMNGPLYAAVYYPYSQLAAQFHWQYGREQLSITYLVRSATDPASLARSMERAVSEVAKDVVIGATWTADYTRWWRAQQTRFFTWLLAAFAGIALVLAAIGVFGVMSYAVTRRTHEIGIRMALGADRHAVLRLIRGTGVRLTLIGLAIGLGAATALVRFLGSKLSWTVRLNEVKPTDPATLAVVCLLLAVVALLACYIPARRATKVDPMLALRYE